MKFTEYLLCSTHEYSSGQGRQKSLPCGVYIRKGWNGQTVRKINIEYYKMKSAREKSKGEKGKRHSHFRDAAA